MISQVQTVVEAASGAELLAQLAQASPQAPGESYVDWMKRLEFQRVVTESERGLDPVYRWEGYSDGSFDKVVRETTADGAWENWGEGVKTPQGAAAPKPVAKASPQTGIKGPGAAGGTVAGLLSMSLPTWVAAAAPLLGVAVGVGLYELSPEFWTKVSQTLLPWCYEDTQAMPVVVDKDGNTYIDKEAVEALKKLFDEEKIGPDYGGIDISGTGASGSLTPYSAPPGLSVGGQLPSGTQYIYVWGSSPVAVTYAPNAGHTVFASSVSGCRVGRGYKPTNINPQDDLNSTYTQDGRTVYYSSVTSTSGAEYHYGYSTVSNLSAAKIAWYSVYGTPIGEYPAGTSKWDGIAVDIAELPITEVYTDPARPDTRDFIPVAMPTAPGQSVDSQTNPDPTVNSEPEKQVSPYINPSIGKDQYPSGSESTGEDDEELDKSPPIPLPYPPNQDTPSPEDNPSDKPKKEKPQKFVDLIPPVDAGDIDLSPLPGFGFPDPADGGVGGLVSVYNPTYSELQAFSQWLWVTYQDATIDKIWNNPFDGIISLYEIYATPVEGTRKYIKSGFLVSTVECATAPQRYIEINCGTGVFPEYYGNYLDYSPYSKALCYLPFIGIVELNVDDIVGHAVNITYRVDVYTGGCIAVITCAREGSNVALYQFSGNCSVQLPIAGGTQSAIRAAQISAGAYQNAYHTAGLAGLAGGLASAFFGGANFISGPISGFSSYKSNEAFGQAQGVSQTVSAKSSVQHSGQFGESYGAMGHKKPYMIIKRPVQVIVPGYQQVYGFQAHKMVQIGACEGFLRCRAVHVVSAQATDEEKSMIEQLLVSGVYVTEE